MRVQRLCNEAGLPRFPKGVVAGTASLTYAMDPFGPPSGIRRTAAVHCLPGTPSSHNWRLLADGLGAKLCVHCYADGYGGARCAQVPPVLAGGDGGGAFARAAAKAELRSPCWRRWCHQSHPVGAVVRPCQAVTHGSLQVTLSAAHSSSSVTTRRVVLKDVESWVPVPRAVSPSPLLLFLSPMSLPFGVGWCF